MELGHPFTGWYYDDDGTLHSPAGYRTTPQQLEHALWLVGMLQFEAIGKHIMFADSPQITPRKIYDWRDYDRRQHISVNDGPSPRPETAPCKRNPV